MSVNEIRKIMVPSQTSELGTENLMVVISRKNDQAAIKIGLGDVKWVEEFGMRFDVDYLLTCFSGDQNVS